MKHQNEVSSSIVIYRYVCRKEVSAKDLEVTIPKAMAMCVAPQTVDGRRMTGGE